MEQKNVGQYYADNIGLVHNVARRGYNRLLAIGASIDYEDVVQDMSIMFIKSFEMFDEEKGKFSTYFHYAAFNQLNKIAKNFETERLELKIKSVEEIDSFTHDQHDYAISERIAGSSASPEQIYEIKQTIGRVMENLSPLARLMADWLIETPEEIEDELTARQAHSLMAREAGIERRCKSDIDLGFVCEMLVLAGHARRKVNSARAELEDTVRRECNE